MVSAIGCDKDTIAARLAAGQSGITRVASGLGDNMPTINAAVVTETLALADPKVRRCDRFVHLAIVATSAATKDAALALPLDNLERVGVVVSSNKGGSESIEHACARLAKLGYQDVQPRSFAASTGAAMVSIMLGSKGPLMNLGAASATGVHSLGLGATYIERGEADIVLAGSAEATLTPLTYATFLAVGALSRRGGEPECSYKVFDLERDGLVLGEGAAVFVLESREHAQARGAKALAEVLAYGHASEGYHLYSLNPTGDGAIRSMRACLQQAEMAPAGVDFICAHGTGTKQNDVYETLAVKSVFGPHAYKMPVVAMKPLIGHTLGAAGAMELGLTLVAMERGLVPPTLNLHTPDPECDLDYVPNVARRGAIHVVMCNSFGFGGYSASLLVRGL
jgi:3-oxoacyl-[acyl-carrier-protein] synthase II